MTDARRHAALLCCLLAALMSASLFGGPGADASSVSPTVIGCSGGTYPPTTEFRAHPHECIVYRGGVEAHYSQIWMQKLRWKRWGRRSSIGHGRWHYCGMGSCPSGPLKVRVYRPVFACGRYAYTRLRIHVVVRNYRDSTYLVHDSPC